MKEAARLKIIITMILSITAVVLVVEATLPSRVHAVAGINRVINFQGKLKNADGTNVTNGNYTVVFSLYDRHAGGTALWSETQTVTASSGIFRVGLGSVTPIPSSFNFNWDGIYLGVKVGSDSEMTPRIQMTAVPYAFNAEKVSGLTVQDDSGNASTSGTLRIANNRVVSFNNNFTAQGALTLSSSGGTTATLPDGVITLVDLAANQTLTNKTIGSTGLTFSGAGIDITTSNNEGLTITPNGNGNVLINPEAGGQAALIVDKIGNSGDVLAASSSGLTRFVIKSNGTVNLDSTQYASCGLETDSSGAVVCATATGAASSVTSSSTVDTTDAATAINNIVISIATVSATPTTAYGDIYVRAHGEFYSANNADHTLTLSIRRTNCSGPVVASPINFTVTGSASTHVGTLEVAGVDTDPGASSQSYVFCGVTNQTTGSTVRVFQLHALVINPSAAGSTTITGTNYFTEISGNGVSDGGVTFLGNLTSDFLLGGAATNSAVFSVTGLASSLHQTSASVSGNLFVMSNNGFGGNVGIGTTNVSRRLTIGSTLGSDATFGMADADVIHGLSDFAPTNSWLDIIPNSSTAGGANIAALTDDGATTALNLYGVFGSTNPTDTIAAINLRGAKSDGSTSVAELGNSETVLQVSNFLTPLMTVLGSGNVGIGTTTPVGKLNVIGTSSTTPAASISASSAFAAMVVDQVNNNGALFTASASGATRFVIANDGNVGIGTASPSEKLDILGNIALSTAGSYAIRWGGNTANIGYVASGGNWMAGTSVGDLAIVNTGNIQLGGGNGGGSTPTMTITGSTVGINSLSPTATLDVAGTASVSGTLTFRNGAAVIAASQRNNLTIGNAATGNVILNPQGNIGIGTTDPRSTLNIIGNSATSPTASISATSTFAALLAEQRNNNGDLFTASQSGTTRFTIRNDGTVYLGASAYASCTALETVAGVLTCGTDDTGSGGGTNFFSQISGIGAANGGVTFLGNLTSDFLLGGTATTSAKFAVLNLDSGTPTGTMSGNFIIMPHTSGSNMLGGNVGIGVTNPGSLLEIGGTNASNSVNSGGKLSISGTLLSGSTTHKSILSVDAILDMTSGTITTGPTGIYNTPTFTSSANDTNWDRATAYTGSIAFNSGYEGTINNGIVYYATKGVFANTNKVQNFSYFYGAAHGNAGSGNGGNTTGTLNNYGLNIQSFTTAAGSGGIVNNYATYLTVPNGSGTNGETNNYGLYLTGNSAAGDVNYSIYNASTALSYFAGNVGIGTTAPSGKLQINGDTGFQALLQINQLGTQTHNDLLTASVAGVTRFAVRNDGTVNLATGIYNNCSTLETINGVISCGTDDASAGAPNFLGQISGNGAANGGVTFLGNLTSDFLIGGMGSTSAEFAFTGLNNGQAELKLNGSNFEQTIASGSAREVGTIKDGVGASRLNGTFDVVTVGKYAYVVSDSDDSLSIIDVSNPSSPVEVGSVHDDSLGGTATQLNGANGVAVSGKYAYVASVQDDALSIIDIANPAAPVEVGAIKDGVGATRLNGAEYVVVVGKYAYVTSDTDNALSIIDISNPASPVEVGTIVDGIGATQLSVPMGIAVSGKYAYVTSSTDSALSIIDISNSSNPVEIGTIRDSSLGGTATQLLGARDVVVSGKYAYVTSTADDALTVIDISNPSSPTQVGVITDDSVGGTATELDFANAITVAGKYAYVTSWNGDAVSIIDISTPSAPVEVSTFKFNRNATQLDSPAGISLSGKYVYVTANFSDALTVIEIPGIDSPSAQIGSLLVGTLSVTEDGSVANNLNVGGGLNVGQGGVKSDGEIVSGGDLTIGAETASKSAAPQKISTGFAGQIASGGTGNIASVTASTVFNGSLYIGTGKGGPAATPGGAEVYRFNQGDKSWSKVSQTAAGTIALSGTGGIASISAMAVWNGNLYVGTSKTGAAEVYRYDGSTTWTKVSHPTAGTISGVSGETAIDGVTAMTVYGGKLYIGTEKTTFGANPTGRAEIYRYDGGSEWTRINSSAGTLITTGNHTGINAISSMIVYNNTLLVGTKRTTAAVYKFNGIIANATTSFTAVATAGSFCGAGVYEVPTMTVYNGKLYAGTRSQTNAAGFCRYEDSGNIFTNAAPSTVWTSILQTNGTVRVGGTANIGSIHTSTVYNGKLYIGTGEPNSAELYQYVDNGDTWTLVNPSAGKLSQDGVTAIDRIATLIEYNDRLIIGTSEHAETGRSGAEVYAYENRVDQSNSLKFRAASSAGSEFDSNVGRITFVASTSANYNTGLNNTGSFVFSNGITTATGAYDVAEDYPTRDDTLSPGELVAIDDNEAGFVVRADGQNNRRLMGVYSENPGFRLSQKDSHIDGARAVPIALVGRVAVKVSTENGPIKAGDPLTISSKAGIAMKATQPGMVIGRSMGTLSCASTETCEGKVMTYINVSYYDPTIAMQDDGNLSIAYDATAGYRVVTEDGELLTKQGSFAEVLAAKITAGSINTKELLAENVSIGGTSLHDYIVQVVQELSPFVQSTVVAPVSQVDRLNTHVLSPLGDGSQIGMVLENNKISIFGAATNSAVTVFDNQGNATFSGSLAAGLSINTPAVNTKTLSVETIKADTTDALAIELGEDGTFVIKSSGSAAVTFDASGNATFKGELSASKIRIEQIAGLEFLTDRLTNLEATVASLSSLLASQNELMAESDVLGASFSAVISNEYERSQEDYLPSVRNANAFDFAVFTTGGVATVSGDLRVTGSSLFEGIVSVIDTLRTRDLITTGVATFFDAAIFKKDVIFDGKATFGSDSAGTAVIKKGANSVAVEFSEAYEAAPVVHAAIVIDEITTQAAQDALNKKILESDTKFIITRRSKNGFTILLKKAAIADLTFSWTALGRKE
jgi:hypothetical protein